MNKIFFLLSLSFSFQTAFSQLMQLPNAVTYRGKIDDKYEIELYFESAEHYNKDSLFQLISGHYLYKSILVPIQINGKKQGNNLFIKTDFRDSNIIEEYFELKAESNSEGKLTGTWRKGSKVLPVKLEKLNSINLNAHSLPYFGEFVNEAVLELEAFDYDLSNILPEKIYPANLLFPSKEALDAFQKGCNLLPYYNLGYFYFGYLKIGFPNPKEHHFKAYCFGNQSNMPYFIAIQKEINHVEDSPEQSVKLMLSQYIDKSYKKLSFPVALTDITDAYLAFDILVLKKKDGKLLKIQLVDGQLKLKS